MLKICKYHNGCAPGSEFADGISKKFYILFIRLIDWIRVIIYIKQ